MILSVSLCRTTLNRLVPAFRLLRSTTFLMSSIMHLIWPSDEPAPQKLRVKRLTLRQWKTQDLLHEACGLDSKCLPGVRHWHIDDVLHTSTSTLSSVAGPRIPTKTASNLMWSVSTFPTSADQRESVWRTSCWPADMGEAFLVAVSGGIFRWWTFSQKNSYSCNCVNVFDRIFLLRLLFFLPSAHRNLPPRWNRTLLSLSWLVEVPWVHICFPFVLVHLRIPRAFLNFQQQVSSSSCCCWRGFLLSSTTLAAYLKRFPFYLAWLCFDRAPKSMYNPYH